MGMGLKLFPKNVYRQPQPLEQSRNFLFSRFPAFGFLDALLKQSGFSVSAVSRNDEPT